MERFCSSLNRATYSTSRESCCSLGNKPGFRKQRHLFDTIRSAWGIMVRQVGNFGKRTTIGLEFYFAPGLWTRECRATSEIAELSFRFFFA